MAMTHVLTWLKPQECILSNFVNMLKKIQTTVAWIFASVTDPLTNIHFCTKCQKIYLALFEPSVFSMKDKCTNHFATPANVMKYHKLTSYET